MKPELRLADQGDDVIAAQKLLKMEGMNIQVDGVFGEKTMEAVRTFQKDKGLPDTGKVDRATRDELLSEGRKRLPSR